MKLTYILTISPFSQQAFKMVEYGFPINFLSLA